MRKLLIILAIAAAIVITILVACSMAAASASIRESDATIERIDRKIRMYEQSRR